MVESLRGKSGLRRCGTICGNFLNSRDWWIVHPLASLVNWRRVPPLLQCANRPCACGDSVSCRSPWTRCVFPLATRRPWPDLVTNSEHASTTRSAATPGQLPSRGRLLVRSGACRVGSRHAGHGDCGTGPMAAAGRGVAAGLYWIAIHALGMVAGCGDSSRGSRNRLGGGIAPRRLNIAGRATCGRISGLAFAGRRGWL